MDLGLRGKKAIVTGGTKGIGRSIVELLAHEGVDIGLCARSADEVEETVRQLKVRGINAVGDSVNVRNGEAYGDWLQRTVEALGGCDIFIPNVSAAGGMDSEKNWIKNFEIDVMHTVRGCDLLLPALSKSGHGSIVLLASTNALETFAAPMAFNAMKATLIQYSKDLAASVAPRGVRVNSVAPGPIFFEGGAWELIQGTQPKFYDWALKQIPSRRLGTPDEVARVVTFLASPTAGWLSGTNLLADNGFTKGVLH
jgi:NAD(P)-dependent dehydrogenase (short-subunit alcohol dehydrogenase family)